MPLIEMKEITKTYAAGAGRVQALDGVSLSIGAGEYTAIVGRSGSGKSTLMNIMGCLDTPTAGHYRLDGQDVSTLGEKRLAAIRSREIGFIFQGFHLIPGLTAQENVELPLFYRGLPREQRRALAVQALERVGLGERLRHHPQEMSGGQQQRVAIARAVAARPPVILADEPTGNLDSASGAEVTEILDRLWREGCTVVLITHDRELAARTQRVIAIEDGRVVRDCGNG